MFVACKECNLLVEVKDGSKCPCGFTELKMVDEKELGDFLRKYVETPITVTFFDMIRDYDKNKDYFIFIIENDYLITNKSKTERTDVIFYNFNKKLSKEDVIKAIQHYQMKSQENLSEITKRIKKYAQVNVKNHFSIRLNKKTIEFIKKEAEKHNLSIARFMQTILMIYEEDKHEYYPF